MDYDDGDRDIFVSRCERLRLVVDNTRVPTTLDIYGHCQDRFVYSVLDAQGEAIIDNRDGYVPEGLGVGLGDDVRMKIDIATGKIIGWDPEAVMDGIRSLSGAENPD